MIIGYGRTSTTEQAAGLADQEARLKAAGADRIYIEQASAAEGKDRPQLDALLGFIRTGDILVVTKLDRLARSVLDAMLIVKRLQEAGAGLRILDMAGAELDTTTPAGKLQVTMFAAFAEFERNLMLERQKVGIAEAKAAGKYKGRKPTAQALRAEIVRLVPELGPAATARQLGIGRTSVYRIMRSAEAAP